MGVFADPDPFAGVVALLGGAAILRGPVRTPLEAHRLVDSGLPGRALDALLGNLLVLSPDRILEQGVRISVRTRQRRAADPDSRLDVDQSGRTWKFAELLALATAVMGDQAEAERWFERPSHALDWQKPIELLSTPMGVEAVEGLLRRVEAGVYT
jgi:putative toxin-antitoxin system antitoxin component (TIGR02293 family)